MYSSYFDGIRSFSLVSNGGRFKPAYLSRFQFPFIRNFIAVGTCIFKCHLTNGITNIVYGYSILTVGLGITVKYWFCPIALQPTSSVTLSVIEYFPGTSYVDDTSPNVCCWTTPALPFKSHIQETIFPLGDFV
jgi:hypothetical protein